MVEEPRQPSMGATAREAMATVPSPVGPQKDYNRSWLKQHNSDDLGHAGDWMEWNDERRQGWRWPKLECIGQSDKPKRWWQRDYIGCPPHRLPLPLMIPTKNLSGHFHQMRYRTYPCRSVAGHDGSWSRTGEDHGGDGWRPEDDNDRCGGGDILQQRGYDDEMGGERRAAPITLRP
jgi:hypothetical protein